MFLLIELSTVSGATSQAMYPYSTEFEATAKFYQKMSGAMQNVNYEEENLIIIDTDRNRIIRAEKMDKPKPKAEISDDDVPALG